MSRAALAFALALVALFAVMLALAPSGGIQVPGIGRLPFGR